MKQQLVIAQNLVANGSFEQYYSCPLGLNSVDSCIGWHKFGGISGAPGTPDYFDTCSSFIQNSVPNNAFGSQSPFEGSAYMGLFTMDYSYWYREYIGTELLDTLNPGYSYTISMRFSRGNRTIYQTDACVASNKMGVRFTTNGYQIGSIIPVSNYAQVYQDTIITDTLNWVLLCKNFIADSAYTHLYIGNFFESDSTDTIQINCPIPPGRAYYYIDSINIVCTSSNCYSKVNELNNNTLILYYNAMDETITVKRLEEKQGIILLYCTTGQLILRRTVNENEKINISELSDGFYMAVLSSPNKTSYLKIIKN